jgi:hypothetical protein
LRLPRDLSGRELIRLLKRYGYESTRQVGSHIRFTIELPRLRSPDNDSRSRQPRIGTLNSILSDVADYLGMDRSNLMQEPFDNA